MTLLDIRRNDVDAAERYYRERGSISSDEYRVLLRLQDNPMELERRSRNWVVKKPEWVDA